MKKIHALLALLVACNYSIGQDVLSGTWRLIQYQHKTEKGAIPFDTSQRKSVIISFKDNGNEGKLSGHTYANKIYGSYTIINKDSISFYNCGGTKVGEDCPLSIFSFPGITNYNICNDNLTLHSPRNGLTFVFKKEDN